jgi:hypothetical protein
MSYVEHMDRIRTGFLVVAYGFLLANTGLIFIDWALNSHGVIEYALFAIGVFLVFAASRRWVLLGAVYYLLLLILAHGNAHLYRDITDIVVFIPVVSLVGAWVVS